MAFSHGKSAIFKVGTAGVPATPTDITAYLTSVSVPKSADTAETSVLGVAAKTYIAGLIDATISIEGRYDPTVDAHLSAIVGHATAMNFEYGPQGGGGSAVKYSGTCICTSYEVGTDIGDAASFSAEFQVTGAVTRGAY